MKELKGLGIFSRTHSTISKFSMGTKVLNFVFDYPKKLPNRGEKIRDFLANSKGMEYLAIYKF